MALITNQAGELTYQTARQIGTAHAFTTRTGGVSKDHLASLNIGIHREDDPQNVLENYRRLGEAVGFDPQKLVLSHQTHSDIIRVVGKEQWGAGLYGPELAECDALITNTPGTALAVFTADCTPILLWDRVTGAVGAVHAGWRGTAANIAGKTVQAMADAFGCDPANICAAVGPNIGQCCFETDVEVPLALKKMYGAEVAILVRRRDEKYYVNLKAINALSLGRAGVETIELSDHCTACMPQLYWSHRRTQGLRGSQGAIIVCGEGKK